MIFCFSGTGNSLHIANKIAAATDDNIIMITESEKRRHVEYHLDNDEKVGFLFPIYWWGMPLLVEEFVREMKINDYKGQYIYAVCTYGLNANNGLYDLKKSLKNKEMPLSANYEVKMVDNYVVGYELKNKDIQSQILLKADEKIAVIINSILKMQNINVEDGPYSLIKPLIHSFYKNKNHQNGFYTTEECIGCHKCENQCPCNAISLEDNKPVWTKNCSFCLKCINTCPNQAIQYNKGTRGRKRYHYVGN